VALGGAKSATTGYNSRKLGASLDLHVRVTVKVGV